MLLGRGEIPLDLPSGLIVRIFKPLEVTTFY
jgi:hypothetical protein